MHGGFENETPNIPTNTIMKLDLMSLFQKAPHLAQKLETSIGSQNKKNAKGGPGSADYSSSDGKKTPPM